MGEFVWDIFTHLLSGLIAIVIYQRLLTYRAEKHIKSVRIELGLEDMKDYAKFDVEMTKAMMKGGKHRPRVPFQMYKGAYAFPEEEQSYSLHPERSEDDGVFESARDD